MKFRRGGGTADIVRPPAPIALHEARASLRDEIERLTASWVPDLTLVAVMSTEMTPDSGREWTRMGDIGTAASCVKYSLGPQSRPNTTAGGVLSHGGDATRQYCSSLEVRTCYYEPARHLGSQE
jgi:hypothetical protein